MKFTMRDFKGKRVHAAHSYSPIEISGHWGVQGPQPISDEGGAPEWVYDLFESNPKIECVAIKTKNGGVIYSPIKD